MIPLNLELAHALPEAILAVGAIVLLLVGAFRGKASDGPMSELAVVVLGLALIVILLEPQLAGWRRLRQRLHRRHASATS